MEKLCTLKPPPTSLKSLNRLNIEYQKQNNVKDSNHTFSYHVEDATFIRLRKRFLIGYIELLEKQQQQLRPPF